ncbi:MAG: AI-2E family transporter [Oscillospiraceae bacterium]|nr:AI-2E family transporter [Oscillospiraceae bacterium]
MKDDFDGGENNENEGKKNKNGENWNKKYTLIAIYSFIVISVSFAAIMVIMWFRDFMLQRQYLGFFKVMSPVIYGFVFAYLLNPLLMFFRDKAFFKLGKKLKNIFSILATYLFTAILVTLLLLMVIPQVIASVQQLTGRATDWLSPYEGLENADESGEEAGAIDIANSKIGVFLGDFGKSIQDYADGLGLKIDVAETFNDLANDTLNLFSSYIVTALNGTINVIYGIFSGILNVILGILLSIYLLIGKDKFIAQVKKLFFALFPAKFSYKLVGIMRKTHEIFGGFIIGKILDSLIVGAICFAVMSIFGIRYTALITVIITVTNIIPFFGPFIGAVPSLFFLAINDIWQALWFLVFIVILQQVDGNFIGPKVLGPKVGLPAFWVIFSIIVMSGFFGLPGIFFGVPVFAVVYVLIKEFAENKLAAKGFPEETEHYVRNPEIPEAKTKKAGDKPAYFGKILDFAAKNIAKIFHKNQKKRENGNDDDENKQ